MLAYIVSSRSCTLSWSGSPFLHGHCERLSRPLFSLSGMNFTLKLNSRVHEGLLETCITSIPKPPRRLPGCFAVCKPSTAEPPFWYLVLMAAQPGLGQKPPRKCLQIAQKKPAHQPPSCKEYVCWLATGGQGRASRPTAWPGCAPDGKVMNIWWMMAELTSAAFWVQHFRQQDWVSYQKYMFMIVQLNIYVGKSRLQAGWPAAKK